MLEPAETAKINNSKFDAGVRGLIVALIIEVVWVAALFCLQNVCAATTQRHYAIKKAGYIWFLVIW